MKENFKDRLRNYRESLNIKKREMSKRLDISEQLYYLLESGTREPSKNVLNKLFLDSEKPTEWWMDGVDKESEYLEIREEFKNSRNTIEQLYEMGLLNEDGCSDEVKEVLLASLLNDARHLILKKKGELK